jgi:glutathionylspermidine synthase
MIFRKDTSLQEAGFYRNMKNSLKNQLIYFIPNNLWNNCNLFNVYFIIKLKKSNAYVNPTFKQIKEDKKLLHLIAGSVKKFKIIIRLRLSHSFA